MAATGGKPALPASQPLPAHDRAAARRWLLELTQVPTASGQEWRVIGWVRRWVAERPELRLTEDRAGNLVVAPVKRWGRPKARPIFITAHLDHPAFVIERVIGPGTVELAFRGGVGDEYFPGARVLLHAAGPGDGRNDERVGTTITGETGGVAGADGSRLFKTYLAEIDGGKDEEPDIRVGDVATWDLPEAVVDERGIVHTHACDDLAAVAAAVSAYDALLSAMKSGVGPQDVRLLFTRSEEIGFTGAIAACKMKTMPRNSRVIALENSRSFADSPIGGGPIVRVGDRLTVFSPGLTAACAKRAEQISDGRIKWQRKLMAGGACEATVFCAYGYEATCLCLPLGNYHNMANLQEVQDKTYDAKKLGPPRVGREFISVEDYHGLIDLLVAIGMDLPEQDPVMERIEKLYEKHKFVLSEVRTPPPRGRGPGGGLKGAKKRGKPAVGVKRR